MNQKKPSSSIDRHYDPDSEQAVLGAMMLDPEVVPEVVSIIPPDAFYNHQNQMFFQAVLELYQENKPVDLPALASKLREEGKVFDISYLANLGMNVGTAANVGYYARRVLDKHMIRQIAIRAQEIYAVSQEQREGFQELSDYAQALFFELTENIKTQEAKKISTLSQDETVLLQNIARSSLKPGFSSGYPDVDRFFTLEPKDHVILAGRTSMGKTALALNIALNVAGQGKIVGFFSLEMSSQQLTRRLLANVGMINGERLNRVQMTADDWRRLYEAQQAMQNLPLFVDDTAGMTILDVRSKARRMKTKYGLHLLVIDYLQLIRPTKRGRTREEEVSEISRGLKATAKELNISILTLSQLNRKLEDRPNKRPRLSDLRESGSIEQDADIVTFIYRDEVYRKDSPHKGIAEMIVAKNRNGRTGTARLTYLEDYLRYGSMEHER